MPGLIVSGREIAVPGLEIINGNDAGWCRLDARDCMTRPTSWVRQIILHTTKGNWPQTVLAGAGAGGKDIRTADMWKTDPTHSGAHIVIDNDGSVACLCDLQLVSAYHATVSNAWSIGIEMYQESNNGVYDAVYKSAVLLVPALCRIFGIQLQVPKLAYKNKPLARMVGGGQHLVGVFGHRDNTDRRGQGDPGDEVFMRLRGVGAESFDFDAKEDLHVWSERQAALNDRGAKLDVDGVPGPATVDALKSQGGVSGIWALDHATGQAPHG